MTKDSIKVDLAVSRKFAQ